MRLRTALPLPRYTQRKPTKSGWAYFFGIPTWARKAGCPLQNEALGTDYAAAVSRAETVLLPAFDSWRTQGASDLVPKGPAPNTLNWLFEQYRQDRRYLVLDAGTKRNHEAGFAIIGKYVMKDGRELGSALLKEITTAAVDKLYDRLVIVEEKDDKGNVTIRHRHTTINHAMKSARRAWNVVNRLKDGKLPPNPFSKMGLRSTSQETPTATYAELKAFRAKAVELGHPSLATAALIAWEWLQREEDIFGTFTVAHYRPKDRPNAVRVLHEKTNEENWIPLFDSKKGELYPELRAELDDLKHDRIAGLLIRRDWGSLLAWPTEKKGDLTLMRHKVKEIIRAANLRDELSFRSFRHGGVTEAADSDLTDAEIRAQSRHKSAKVLPRYAKRTMKQVAAGAEKRRLTRTEAEDQSE